MSEEIKFDWNKPFVTIDGKPARSVCSDYRPYGQNGMMFHLVLITEHNGQESFCSYKENGRSHNDYQGDTLVNFDASI